MYERVIEELELLKRKYPQLQYGDQINWVLIPEFQLPDRFNKTQTQLLLAIPAGYPQTAPDNFFVDIDLRLKDGSNPANFNLNAESSSGIAPIPGNWGWFSWHVEQGKWLPSADINKGDNLSTFLRSVNICLRGEE